MLWLKYGIWINDVTVSSVNAFGGFLALFSSAVYYKYTADRGEVEKRFLQVLGFLAMLFLAVRAGLFSPQIVGYVAMVGSVTMFGSPLVALKSIIQKEDSSVLSLPNVVMTVVVSTAWTLYGLTIGDFCVILPNALGILIGII